MPMRIHTPVSSNLQRLRWCRFNPDCKCDRPRGNSIVVRVSSIAPPPPSADAWMFPMVRKAKQRAARTPTPGLRVGRREAAVSDRRHLQLADLGVRRTRPFVQGVHVIDVEVNEAWYEPSVLGPVQSLHLPGHPSRVASPHGDGRQVSARGGGLLAIAGLGALGLAKLGVDRVPGTLSWKSDNVTVFVPIGLMLLVSIVGTIVLNVFLRR